tara:strand:+ start:7479 stop:7994 length:516 start_codon:yes stop_codon:yes gene_type:complete
MEIFKDIPGYEGFYQVSNKGNVKSLAKTLTYKDGRTYNYDEKILKPGSDGKGYLMVILCVNRKKQNIKVHRLVAMAFLNYVSDGTNKIVVDHIDNNRLNNHLENLQLITNRENSSKDKKGCSSKYTGVYWNRKRKKWTSAIEIGNKRIALGVFDVELDAHNAYQKALKELV